MAKLTDKAFYNKEKKAVKKASTKKKALTVDELYDAIVHTAQVHQTGAVRVTWIDQHGRQVHQSEFAAAAWNNPKLGGGPYPEPGWQALVELLDIEGNVVDSRKAPAVVQRPMDAQMQPQAPQSDMQVGQVPVQDKVQQLKDIGLNDMQVEQVMKTADDEGDDNKKESAPGDEENKKKDETPAPPEQDAPETPLEPKDVQLQDEPRLAPGDEYLDEGELVNKKPEAPKQPPDFQQQQPPLEELLSPEVEDQKRLQLILSFLGYVAKLQEKATRIRDMINPPPTWVTKQDAAGNPVRVRVPGGRKPGGAEMKMLMREDAKMEKQIERAGNMYKKMLRLVAPKPPTKKELEKDPNAKGRPGIPMTEALQWLEAEMAKRHKRPPALERPMQQKQPAITQDQADQFPNRMVKDMDPDAPVEVDKQEDPKKKKSDGSNPAGTAANPMDGQRDSLSKEEVPGTGKMAQAAPPGAPGQAPGGPPTPEAPPAPGQDGTMGMDPSLVEDPVEDSRSLAEVLEDLELDVEALTQKIENGDAILDGQEVEPVETDSGAMPAPAPMVADKQAVDEDAKGYYKSYWGEYGMSLTKDRVAEVVDIIDEVSNDYGIIMTAAQVDRLVNLLSHAHKTDIPELQTVADRGHIAMAIKTGMYLTDYPVNGIIKQALSLIAYAALPKDIKAKHDEFVRLADSKIKKPKVKGQPDDAVKVDKLKDKAEDEDHMLARPAHLEMEVESKRVEGAYLKLTIKWDADAEAADRSDDGLKQMVLSFVKAMESKKEPIDYGFLGEPEILEMDAEAGMAEVSVRTKKPGDAPLAVDDSK